MRTRWRRRTLERAVRIGLPVPEPEEALRSDAVRRRAATQLSEETAYHNDEEVDDLLRVPFDIDDERVRDGGRGCDDDNDLVAKTGLSRFGYTATRCVPKG